MCHWQLRVWTCGDSFFTKCSSCSIDRAAHFPANPLNPLHHSIRPFDMDSCKPPETLHATSAAATSTRGPWQNQIDEPILQWTSKTQVQRGDGSTRTKNNVNSQERRPSSNAPEAAVPTIVSSQIQDVQDVVYPRDSVTGRTIPVPLSKIGQASRFGDQSLGGGKSQCNVFEVVQQSQERTACPACARSPKRARLPAHARGCFGSS